MNKAKNSDKINFYDETSSKSLNENRKKVLEDKLNSAIKSEEYELAAELRDQILELKNI